MNKAKGKASEVSVRQPWLRLLALDGGGVRGLSSLMVLQHLMETLNPDTPPKPCDYFHLIGGTSTGGLIAIMLGRLRMTVADCITAYTQLSSNVFKKRRHRVSRRGNIQGRFDSRDLERAVKKILTQQGFDEDELLKDTVDAPCKVFVCTRSASADRVCLTSYRSPRGGSHLLDSVKIWEACRATSAAPSFFDRITIGPFQEEFIDGALGENNPIYSVWNQAQDIWNDGPLQDKILYLVSIGTGIPSLNPFQDSVIDLGKALVALSTESEETAERFHRDKASLDNDGRYYRFNVIRGLEGIGLQESERKKDIAAATLRYITSQAVFNKIKACAEKMLTQGNERVPSSIDTTSLSSISFLDPLTLMFSVLRAVDRAVNMLQSCQRIAARVGIPISFITSLRIECLTIRLSLKQIKNIITQAEKESLEEIFQADTLEEYNAILESCHLTFYILNKHMSTLELRTIQYTDKAALRAELGALSMNSQMEEVNRAIMGLSHGVRILGTAFEFENSLRATAVLGSPETKRIVSQISRDSVSLQDSFHMETNINETNSQGFEYGDQDCDIDDLLINTTLYRRAFIRNLMRSQPEEIHEPSTPKPAAISDYKQLDDTASRLDGSDYEQLYYTASEPDRSDCEQLYYTASESGSGDMQPDENLLEGLESRSETPKPNADLREIRFDDVNQTMLSEWFQSLQIPVRQLPDEQETFVSIMTPVYTIPSLILNSNIVASDYLLHLNAEETNEDPESLEYPGTFEFSSVSDPKAFSTPAPEDSNPQQDLAQCA